MQPLWAIILGSSDQPHDQDDFEIFAESDDGNYSGDLLQPARSSRWPRLLRTVRIFPNP